MSIKTNLAGATNLADSIINEKPNHVSFAEDFDSELEDIPIPDVNKEVRCSECMSYDWDFKDADYEGDRKFFRFVCNGKLSADHASFGNTWGEKDAYCECKNDLTIYLDENNQPIFPKVRK